MTVRILQGHVMEKLQALPHRSVQMCVTSPPYYALRDYHCPPQLWDDPGACPHQWGDTIPGDARGASGTYHGRNGAGEGYARDARRAQFCPACGAWQGSLGLEPDIESYVRHLVQVFREVRRVLRDDGLLAVVIGDSYAAQWSYQVRDHKHVDVGNTMAMAVPPSLKPGDLIGIPWRFALAMQADGWWLRRDIIWAKGVSLCPTYSGTTMPESVVGWRWERHRVKVAPCSAPNHQGIRGANLDGGWTKDTHPASRLPAQWQDCPGCRKCADTDGLILRKGSGRPTTSHEYVFMFAKTARYFYDSYGVQEPITDYGQRGTESTYEHVPNGGNNDGLGKLAQRIRQARLNGDQSLTRNLRSVWAVNPEPLTLTVDGVSHYAAFPTKLVDTLIRLGTSEKGCCPACGGPWARVVECGPSFQARREYECGLRGRRTGAAYNADYRGIGMSDARTRGWRPSCRCQASDPIPCTVLDPFAGAGTTGLVADRLGRDAVLIELNPDYCVLAAQRLAREAPLFMQVEYER